MLTPP